VIELELGTFRVREIEIGSPTRFEAGILTIDPAALQGAAVEGSELFERIDVEIVRPGDNVRVVHAVDSVEPRIRVSNPGSDFPGMLGLPRPIGVGRTHRLDGIAVTTVSEPVRGEGVFWREAALDMSGPGAAYSPLSEIPHVILWCRPNADRFPPIDRDSREDAARGNAAEWRVAMSQASLKGALHLAETVREAEPDEVETLALTPAEGLPRVVCCFQVQSEFLYGEPIPTGGMSLGIFPMPTVLHPNEVLDGAVVNAGELFYGGVRNLTWIHQNHPVVRELYDRHGRDLDFAGVIFYSAGVNNKTKERSSLTVANLAELLGADGAITYPVGGGHLDVDNMLLCQKLEQRGIRATTLLPEMAMNPDESGFVHFVREADAIVSVGNYEEVLDLPSVGRAIGGTHMLASGEPADGAIKLPVRFVLAATSLLGLGRLSGVQY
jgi:glycine reductase